MANYLFSATCVPTDLRSCLPGTKFLDPCDCKRYFQCSNLITMETLECNNGTLWDYTLGNCNHDYLVDINQNCTRTNSWTRCNTTASRYEELRVLCTGISNTTPNLTVTTPGSQPSTEGSSVSPGLVAGLILAGAVITLAVIALFVLYSRRKKARKAKEQTLKRRKTAENREYFQNDVIDDPYAIIDDRMLDRVTNQSNTLHSENRNGTISTTSTTLPPDSHLAEYDNPAARDDNSFGREDGYTKTLERSPVSPYDILSSSGRSFEAPQNTTNNADTLGASVENGGHVFENDVVGNSNLEVDRSPKDDVSEGSLDRDLTDMQTPDYYKLEAVE